MKEPIKHIDPFLGEIQLREVGSIRPSYIGDHNGQTYYICVDEKIKERGLDAGLWYKDFDGKIKHMNPEQITVISRIYDKLTRIE